MKLDSFPPAVQEMLLAFDQDGDGTVDPHEIGRAAELYHQSKQKTKQLGRLVFFLLIMLLLMLAAITGTTFAVVELSKETHTSSDGVTTVAGQEGVVAKTGPVARPTKLSSLLPDSAFQSLDIFVVDSPTGAHLELNVLGWYRVKPTDSIFDEYVTIITFSGNIKLKGESMQFEPLVGNAFVEAGFEVRAGGRKLHGVYEIIGLFNSIEEWEGLDVGEGPPMFGQSDFVMEYDVFYKCNDKCYTEVFEDTLKSVVTAEDGDGLAVKIARTAYHDVHIGAVLEYTVNPEFEYSTKVSYMAANMSVEYQLSGLTADAEVPYYCVEEGGAWPSASEPQPVVGSFNVSNATKIGESYDAATGVTIREFSIDVAINEAEYIMLTDGAEPGDDFIGLLTLTYFDEKESLHPVKMKIGPNITMVFNTFYEESVNLEDWRTPTNCIADDPYASHTPTMMGEDPYMFDHKRRRQLLGLVPVENYGDAANETYIAKPFYLPDFFDPSFPGIFDYDDYTYDYADDGEAVRRTLSEIDAIDADLALWLGDSPSDMLDDEFADGPAALRELDSASQEVRARSLLGRRRRSRNKNKRNLQFFKKAAKAARKAAITSPNTPYCPDDWPADTCYPDLSHTEKAWQFGNFEFEMHTWNGGCFIKEAKVSGGRCPGGGTLYGTCSGTTPLLCRGSWGFRCAIGCEWTFENFLPNWIVNALKGVGLNLDATLFVELGYSYKSTFDLKGGGSIGKIKKDWTGWTSGAEASFEVQGTINVATRTLGVKFAIGGKACWGGCVSLSYTVVDLSQSY